jgi:hypothetical protein
MLLCRFINFPAELMHKTALIKYQFAGPEFHPGCIEFLSAHATKKNTALLIEKSPLEVLFRLNGAGAK